MAEKRIELPGGVQADLTPDRSEEVVTILTAIFRQLQEVTKAMNAVGGALDVLIRLEAGEVTKSAIKKRIEAHDAAQRAANAAAQGEDAAGE